MSSFSSSRFAVYKIKPYNNTTDNKLKNTFSWLKNSVHVEPIWFSLDNLPLCGHSNYTSMVLHEIKKTFRYAEAFLLRTGRFFFYCFPQKQRQAVNKTRKFGAKFLRVLIFAIFATFLAIRKISMGSWFPQKKFTQKFSLKNLLQSKSYSG